MNNTTFPGQVTAGKKASLTHQGGLSPAATIYKLLTAHEGSPSPAVPRRPGPRGQPAPPSPRALF